MDITNNVLVDFEKYLIKYRFFNLSIVHLTRIRGLAIFIIDHLIFDTLKRDAPQDHLHR